MKIQHAIVLVSDMARATAFYRDFVCLQEPVTPSCPKTRPSSKRVRPRARLGCGPARRWPLGSGPRALLGPLLTPRLLTAPTRSLLGRRECLKPRLAGTGSRTRTPLRVGDLKSCERDRRKLLIALQLPDSERGCSVSGECSPKQARTQRTTNCAVRGYPRGYQTFYYNEPRPHELLTATWSGRRVAAHLERGLAVERLHFREGQVWDAGSPRSAPTDPRPPSSTFTKRGHVRTLRRRKANEASR